MTTVTLSDIRQAMSVIGPSVANRSTMPILENVLVERVDGHLRIQATNLKTSASIMIPARGEGEQVRITVPFQKLSGYVSTWPESEMRFVVEDGAMKLRGRSRPQIRGLNPDDFPPVPVKIPEGLPATSVDAQELKDMVARMVIPTSNEYERPVGSSIHLTAFKNTLWLDSTDATANMALGEVKTNGIEGEYQATVYANLFLNLVKTFQGRVQIAFDDRRVLFSTENTISSIQMVDVNYPKLREILTVSPAVNVRLDRDEFLGAMQRARLMLDGFKVYLRFSPGNLNISVPDAENGSFSEDISCDANCEIELPLHADYLISAAKTSREIMIGFTDTVSPVVVSDDCWRFITMPFN